MLFWNRKPKRKKRVNPNRKNVPPINKIERVTKPKTERQTPKQEKDIPRKPRIKDNKLKVEPKKEFLRVFKQLTYKYRAWTIWSDFIIMFACAISNGMDKSQYEAREKRYMNIIKKYNKRDRNLFPELVAFTVLALEQNPEQDFLGNIFMELNLGNGANGQFFTPYNVCDLMASITISNDIVKQVHDKGYVTIHDSCCGAGATLIAGIHEAKRQLEKVNINYQNHVLVTAQDVDETVALMCYIQLSLLGVAAYIKVDNSLTAPISADDTKENYWFTPMYFSDIWVTRRMFHRLDEITKGGQS